MPVPKDLLDIMACAFCKSELRQEGEKLHCANPECKIVYSVKDDIPIMLIDEAETVDDGEHDRLVAKAEAEGIQPTFEA